MIPRLWYGALVPLLIVVAVASAVYFFMESGRERTVRLTITAGDALGRRHELALNLADVAPNHGLVLSVVPTEESSEALEKIADGELDVALVQGGIEPRHGVRQVAALYVEPLHLLVKTELEADDLGDLRGRTLNLSTQGSGTRLLASLALEFAGLSAGRDYQDLALSYGELEELARGSVPDVIPRQKMSSSSSFAYPDYEPSPAEMPDAIFAVSSMPFPLAEELIQSGRYRLMELPLAPALSIRDFMIHEASIPAMAYRVVPPEPRQPISTLGTQLLLVAGEDVDPEAVGSLLDAVFAGEFARASDLAQLDEGAVARAPEYPLHEGTRRWLARNQPVLTNDTIKGVENVRSLLVSIAVALLLTWRWNRQRRILGFEPYLARVNEIERQAADLEDEATMDLGRLLELRREVTRLKTDALDKFVHGNLKGEDLMSSFLAHVSDTRESINNLILHERSRLERLARSDSSASQSEIRLAELWQKALHEGGEEHPGKD